MNERLKDIEPTCRYGAEADELTQRLSEELPWNEAIANFAIDAVTAQSFTVGSATQTDEILGTVSRLTSTISEFTELQTALMESCNPEKCVSECHKLAQAWRTIHILEEIEKS